MGTEDLYTVGEEGLTNIHRLTAEEALASLHSRLGGLGLAVAAHRLLEFGPNQVESLPLEPIWLKFLKGFIHFFAFLLWFAAALAFVAEWSAPGQGMAMLGYAILGVILLNFLSGRNIAPNMLCRLCSSCCQARSR